MARVRYFKGRRVAIIGLGRSGLACANLLSNLGANINITDSQDNDSTRENARSLNSKKIKIELGRHTQGFIRGRELVVISPGVSDTALAVKWSSDFNIPVISEIELAWLLCPATVIAITGSNGKTTVTTLIGEVLKEAGKKVFVCGNIGNPFSAVVTKMKAGDFVSLEVSSFQLEKIREFKPRISVILNFSPNHLDRYKDMDEYLEAKKRIFMNQDQGDYLVLNQKDTVVSGLAKEAQATAVYFNETPQLNPNQAAVVTVARILGINKEVCLKVFKNFKGIAHRLEQVATINKVKFINDSKSTTVDSTIWALRNISGPIILIAGGKHKGVDYRRIRDLVKQKVRRLILIGEARQRIKDALGDIVASEQADSLKEAVSLAFKKARFGDCVLLSPMCSSFDMFSDFQERGDAFKKTVFELKNNSRN